MMVREDQVICPLSPFPPSMLYLGRDKSIVKTNNVLSVCLPYQQQHIIVKKISTEFSQAIDYPKSEMSAIEKKVNKCKEHIF